MLCFQQEVEVCIKWQLLSIGDVGFEDFHLVGLADELQLAVLKQQGRGFSLVTEYKNHMADLLLDFLRNFEYDKVREIAGSWSFRDKTVGDYLDEWQACASNDDKDSIGTDRLLDTIDCIYNFLVLLHKSGKNTLGEMIEEVGK